MTSLERGKPKIRIRPMEHEDIDAVLAIDRKITGVRRAVTYTDLITGDLGGVLALSLVAEVNGQVAGFILARRAYVGEPVTEVGLVQILGVDPEYWRQGIATKLVNALLDTCRSKGLNAVWIMINQRDSQLQGLFEHLGFRRGELIDYTKTLTS
jgi:ribosomal protein S18 acetylase RimI-like enzyme